MADPTVIDLAQNGGPPEGELGTVTPTASYGASVWGAYDVWSTGWGLPSEKQLCEMLDRDGKGEGLYQVLTLPMRWAERVIEPAEGDTGEAELVRNALERPPYEGGMSTPLDHVVAQAANAIVYRRTFWEKVFGLNAEGQVTYRKLAWRPTESCRLVRDKDDGGFDGFRQRVPFDHKGADDDGYVRIPAEKALVYLHDAARAPMTGRSALETAYRAYEAKQKIRYLWFIFQERMSGGWGLAKDESGDPDAANSLAHTASGLKGMGFIGLGKDQSVELLEPSEDGAAFKDCMDWLSAEMSGSVLASFTDLAQQGSGKGSFALSKDQTDFYLRACGARLNEIAATLTTFACADLVKWNFGQAGRTPRFRFKPLTPENEEQAKSLFDSLLPQIPTASATTPWLGELFEQISEKVAANAGLNVDKVRQAIDSAGGQDPAAQVSNGASAAVQLLQEAGVTPGGVAATGAA